MNEFIPLLIVKSTVVLVLGFVVASLLRSAAASARYAAWALTFATIVALPIAMIAMPTWQIAVGSAPAVITPSEPMTIQPQPLFPGPDIRQPTLTEATETGFANSASSPESPGLELSPMILLMVWLAGVFVVIARIVAGRYSLRRLESRAAPLDDYDWNLLLLRESQRLGIDRDVRICSSDRVSTPLAGGLRSPVIILPGDAPSWPTEHREVVLRHELAHIARGDTLVCLISGIACAIYWINPLVWMASRRLRTEQERSCDDRVLTLGTSAADYAEHLLQVARKARDIGMHSFVSVAMARPSQLEGRLLAVLQDRRRGSLDRSRRVSAAALALIALVLVSAIRPVPAEAVVVAAQADSPILLNPVAVNAPSLIPKKPAQEGGGDSVATGDIVVSSGGTLVLDLKTGAGVRIIGTDDNHVRMRAVLSGKDWRNTNIAILSEGSGARITTEYANTHGTTSSSHHMEIQVPHRFNVRIRSAGGSVFIRDVEGDFSGSTGGGEINIRDARGSAHLTTGGGPINVASSNLSGSVSTGGGAVLIQDVSGGLSGHSGSGGVFYGGDKVRFTEVSAEGVARSTDGKLFISKAGGSVSIGDAPDGVTISTGGGRVSIGDADGAVSINTGGGDITIASASKGAKVTTGAGDVRLTITGDGGYPVHVESGSGNVTLTLPADISADLDLETAFTRNHRRETRIVSDWPLNTTVTPDWVADKGTPRRYVRTRQSLGNGGAKITVRTVNGDIVLKRR